MTGAIASQPYCSRGKGGGALAHAGAAGRIVHERADRGGDGRRGLLDPESALARFNLAATGVVRVAMTGTPAASDSTTASPKLSESEHWTITSASFSSAHLSAPLTASSAWTAPACADSRRMQIRDEPVLVRPGEHEVRRWMRGAHLGERARRADRAA